MDIKLHEITVKEIFDGYEDKVVDNGVVGYHGKLDIRPPYQRNFVYSLEEERAVKGKTKYAWVLIKAK